jgi:monoamine oxidase
MTRISPTHSQISRSMNIPEIPDPITRTRSIANLRQTRREIAQFNQELAEIEAQLVGGSGAFAPAIASRSENRELYAQKLARIGKSTLTK